MKEQKLDPAAQDVTPNDLADRYRILFENSADAILIIEDGKFVDCNQAVVEMLRYSDKRTLLQTHPSELSPEFQPDGRRSYDKANELMAICIEKGSHRFEWDHMKADGEVFPVEVSLTAIPSENGYDLHTVWRDVSERKQLENELRHAQKMEAVGKLAGGVAHDFNNQLVPILGYTDLLENSLDDQPKLKEWVQEIKRAANFASALVNKLLAFSRKDVRQPVALDLNASVSELLGMLTKLIGEDISVDFSDASESLWIKSDPGDVEQIVLNLASNARDALPEGGEIKLNLCRKKHHGEDYACLEMVDKGIGMDAETLSQIYVPFFTTKGLGSGTGLGMSTVYGLVTKAGGEIVAKSSPGKGTTVRVLFPLTEARPEMESTDEEETADGQLANADYEGSYILVVEDEAQVARLTRRVLSEEGFRVTEASSGIEALEILKLEAPDLILTDVVMGEMSGPAMIKKMEAQNIHIPVMFMSGYTDDRLATHGFDVENISLLRKPFTPAALVSKVRAALTTARIQQ